MSGIEKTHITLRLLVMDGRIDGWKYRRHGLMECVKCFGRQIKDEKAAMSVHKRGGQVDKQWKRQMFNCRWIYAET